MKYIFLLQIYQLQQPTPQLLVLLFVCREKCVRIVTRYYIYLRIFYSIVVVILCCVRKVYCCKTLLVLKPTIFKVSVIFIRDILSLKLKVLLLKSYIFLDNFDFLCFF